MWTRKLVESGYIFVLIALILSIVAGCVLILVFGVNPIDAYAALLQGALGGPYQIGSTIIRMLPLIIGGLAVTISYKTGMFNIGGDGQIILGAMSSFIFCLVFADLPSFILIPVALIVGFLGGAMWAFIPGWIKINRDFSIVVTTLLMNYIAYHFLSYMVRGPIQAPDQFYARTQTIVEAARLPIIISQYRIHIGVPITIILVFLMFFLLWKTSLGFQFRTIGINLRAAKSAGLNVERLQMIAILISGGLMGLAGSIELLGSQYRMLDVFLYAIGYRCIAVAIVGQLNPFGVVVGAFFFAVLTSGANFMQMSTGIPVAIVTVFSAILIIFVISGLALKESVVSNLLRRNK